MLVKGKAEYLNHSEGVRKKNQKKYHCAKFLDYHADQIHTFFVTENLADKIEKLSLTKGDSVYLTFSLSASNGADGRLIWSIRLIDVDLEEIDL